MGLERWYVALPDDTDLLARAKVDPEFGRYLGWPSIFASGGVNCFAEDKPGREFCQAVKKLNAEHPGLKNRVCSLDRSYNKLHYLLSDERECRELDDKDWGTQAIQGVLSLPEHLYGIQGVPVRYSPSETVQEISYWLGSVTRVYLREAYDPVAIYGQDVYKSSGDDIDGEDWNYSFTHFEAWQAFYLEVAKHREGVVVITV